MQRNRSITHCATILSGVGAADEDAAFEVDADCLVAAEGAECLDEAVSLGLERAPHVSGDAGLQGDRADAVGWLAGRLRRAEVAESRGVASLLDIHAEVDQVAEDLGVPLSLHVAAHQPETQPGLP